MEDQMFIDNRNYVMHVYDTGSGNKLGDNKDVLPHEGHYKGISETTMDGKNGLPRVMHNDKPYGLRITPEDYHKNRGYLVGTIAVDNPGEALDSAGYPDAGYKSLDRYPEIKAAYERLFAPLKAKWAAEVAAKAKV